MNILFLVAYTPTPIRTRPYNLLRGLVGRGYQVTLAERLHNGSGESHPVEGRGTIGYGR
jgi:hypothetical protein